MKIRERLSYANVTATLALMVALATGGAYAESKIGASEIQNRAVTAKKIKKGAIRNAHVRRDALTGKRIREGTLNSFQFSALNGGQALSCNPADSTFVNCATTTVQLASPGRALVVATGGMFSEGLDPAQGTCEVRVDGQPELLRNAPGEESIVNTSTTATNGFARTLVTPLLPSGPVTLTLACNQSGSADFRVADPTIAALALTNGR